MRRAFGVASEGQREGPSESPPSALDKGPEPPPPSRCLRTHSSRLTAPFTAWASPSLLGLAPVQAGIHHDPVSDASIESSRVAGRRTW